MIKKVYLIRWLSIMFAVLAAIALSLVVCLRNGYEQRCVVMKIRSNNPYNSIGYGSNTVSNWAPAWVCDYLGLVELVGIHRQVISNKDVEQLGVFPNLKEVAFTDASLDPQALKAIASLSTVKELRLDRSNFDFELLKIPVSKLTLRSLDLTGTRVNDAFVIFISETCLALEHLDLSNTSVTDAVCISISRLPKLERLNLGATEITDEGLNVLGQAPNLKFIYIIENTKVSPDEIAQFRIVRPDVEVWNQR